MNHFFIQNVRSLILDRPFKRETFLHNRYEIIDVLGMGSYGITYVAKDHQLNRECVLKQMKPSRKKMEKVQCSFQYEKEILSFLSHPQIPAFGESFTDLGHHFFTMDYINGKTFEELIFHDGVVYHEIDAFIILRDVLDIVSYIHKRKVIHRDLRIPNIMVKDGTIYIVDFGLARLMEEKSHVLSSDMDGYDFEKKLKRELHYRSDFYALGHFVLFLLYSSFTPLSKKEQSWEEELQISKRARLVLRRLLQLDFPYTEVEEVIADVDKIININE